MASQIGVPKRGWAPLTGLTLLWSCSPDSAGIHRLPLELEERGLPPA
jgi:hypothetical protein